MKQISTLKAIESDVVLAEVCKSGDTAPHDSLVYLFQTLWEKKQQPQEFTDDTIVHVFKRNGNHQSCKSHRGISLLSIGGNTLSCERHSRLLHRLEQLLPERQRVLRTGGRTVDMTSASRQLQ